MTVRDEALSCKFTFRTACDSSLIGMQGEIVDCLIT